MQAIYSGADAQTLDRTVTSIIEDEMNGIENFLYMSAISRSNGTAQITVTLKPGTDLDIARTQVQDRLSRVEPRLPPQVRQLGITVTKASSGFLMLIALQSTGGASDVTAIGNFASNNIVNELRRIAGVGDVQLFGSTSKYIRGVDAMLAKPLRWLLVFVVACLAIAWLFARLPGGFLPTEDQGHIFVSYTGAPGSTTARTQQAVDQVEAFLREQPQMRNVATVTGFSCFGQGQSAALSFVDLHPRAERPGSENSASALVRRANAAFRGIPESLIFALDPPAIPSLGNATGFTMKIQDRSGIGGAALQQASLRLMAEAAASPVLAGVRAEGLPPAPQLCVEVDRVKARALGLQVGQVNQALSLSFGSNYVNDFVFEGNVLRVFIQADAAQRTRPEDVLALRLRNSQNESVPFSAFPRIALTGNLGFASAELGDLFKSSNQAWSVGGLVSLPIFDGGQRQAQLGVAQARRDELVALYQRTVQTAFSEVSEALIGRRRLQEPIAVQVSAVEAQRRLAEVAELRYENGISIYLEVVDARRSLFSAEQQLIQLRASALQNGVSLYVALGGGPAGP